MVPLPCEEARESMIQASLQGRIADSANTAEVLGRRVVKKNMPVVCCLPDLLTDLCVM